MELLLQLMGIKTMTAENQAFLRQHGWSPSGLALVADADIEGEDMESRGM